MSQICRTNKLEVMDLSKVFTEGENIEDRVTEIGLPPLICTNKAIYKCVFGSGIIENTGEKYETYNQITKEFDFSEMYPIYQNTWEIVATRPERALKILTYQMMMEFNSILRIDNYFSRQWSDIVHQVRDNIKAYEISSSILPQIPLLKELIDGFFVECKDLISHISTIFKLYYLKQEINEQNPTETECLKKIKKEEFLSNNRNELINVFYNLSETGQTLRAIRNALSHPENYAQNSFSLYNVHWGNNKTLVAPIIEYRTEHKKKHYEGQIGVLEYVNTTYNLLLKICGSFLNILIEDLDQTAT